MQDTRTRLFVLRLDAGATVKTSCRPRPSCQIGWNYHAAFTVPHRRSCAWRAEMRSGSPRARLPSRLLNPDSSALTAWRASPDQARPVDAKPQNAAAEDRGVVCRVRTSTRCPPRTLLVWSWPCKMRATMDNQQPARNEQEPTSGSLTAIRTRQPAAHTVELCLVPSHRILDDKASQVRSVEGSNGSSGNILLVPRAYAAARIDAFVSGAPIAALNACTDQLAFLVWKAWRAPCSGDMLLYDKIAEGVLPACGITGKKEKR